MGSKSAKSGNLSCPALKYGQNGPPHQVSSKSDKNCQNPPKSCPRILDRGAPFQKFSKIPKIFKNFKNFQKFQKFSKISKILKVSIGAQGLKPFSLVHILSDLKENSISIRHGPRFEKKPTRSTYPRVG